MRRLVPWRRASLVLVLAVYACGGEATEKPPSTGAEAALARVALVHERLAADVAAAPSHPLEALQATPGIAVCRCRSSPARCRGQHAVRDARSITTTRAAPR